MCAAEAAILRGENPLLIISGKSTSSEHRMRSDLHSVTARQNGAREYRSLLQACRPQQKRTQGSAEIISGPIPKLKGPSPCPSGEGCMARSKSTSGSMGTGAIGPIGRCRYPYYPPDNSGPLFRRQRGGTQANGSRGNAGDPTTSRPPRPGDPPYKGNRKGRRPVVGSRMGSW